MPERVGACPQQPSQFACIQPRLHAQRKRLKTALERHAQFDACGIAHGDHFIAFRRVARHGFLAQNVQDEPACAAWTSSRGAGRRRADGDNVGPRLVEEHAIVGVPPRRRAGLLDRAGRVPRCASQRRLSRRPLARVNGGGIDRRDVADSDDGIAHGGTPLSGLRSMSCGANRTRCGGGCQGAFITRISCRQRTPRCILSRRGTKRCGRNRSGCLNGHGRSLGDPSASPPG